MESIVDVLYYISAQQFGVVEALTVWAPYPLELCVGWPVGSNGDSYFECKTAVGGIYSFTLSGGFTI
jgi:hypothetical protein